MAPTLISPPVSASLARVPHVVPYQGSKRNLTHAIIPLIPADTAHLVEPFAGSAAVSVAALHSGAVQRVTINDLNAPLMGLWEQIRDDPSGVVDRYGEIWVGDVDQAARRFLDVRDRFNRDHDPIDLLYLLTRCVKAAVRYNAKGEFNQSADKRRLGTKPSTLGLRIRAVHSILVSRTTVGTGDFRPLLHGASLDDVIYMDPPYQGTSGPRDGRYLAGLTHQAFSAELAEAVRAGASMIISYDGATGEKTYGQALPDSLGMLHMHVATGVSSQATLQGISATTIESLYASPALVDRLGGEQSTLDTLRRDVLQPEVLFA